MAELRKTFSNSKIYGEILINNLLKNYKYDKVIINLFSKYKLRPIFINNLYIHISFQV